MALATRPKPKTQHRKRLAQHHRQGKNYLKTYWPYLPMFSIIAGGVYINKLLYQHMAPAASPSAVASLQGSRLQSLLGNQSDWILLAALALSAAAFAYFVLSHWYRLHRLMNHAEAYAVAHPWLEILVVMVFTSGFVLTR